MPLMQRLEHVKLGADADADASRFVLERALDLKVTRQVLDALGDEFDALTAPVAAPPPPPGPPAPRAIAKPAPPAVPASNSPLRTVPSTRDMRRPSRARASGPPSPPPFPD
jgi:hypothetical protein